MKFSKTITSWFILSASLFIFISRNDYLRVLILNRREDLAALGQISIPWRFWSDTILSLGGLFLFVLAISGWGWLLLRLSNIRYSNSYSHLITAFLFGEIFLSIVLLLLADRNALSPAWSWAILLGGLIPGYFLLRQSLQFAKSIGQIYCNLKREEKSLLFLIPLVSLAALFYSSSRLTYDANVIYFSEAKIIAMSGKAILFHPTDRFLVSALHASILFTPLIQTFGDQAARMLTWAHALAVLAAGYWIAGRLGLTFRAKLYFLAIMLTTTAFVDLSGDGKIDLIALAVLVTAIGWVFHSTSEPSRRHFLLIGIFFGWAIVARPYNAMLIPLFLLPFYLLWTWENLRSGGRENGLRRTLSVLWILPPIPAFGLFYLFLNARWLGSPLAPLEYVEKIDWSPWLPFDPRYMNVVRLLYPLVVTFLNLPPTMGNLSPIVVGVAPFLFFRSVRSALGLSAEARRIFFSALFALASWVSLSFTILEIRYVLFLWVLLFLFAAQVLEKGMQFLQEGYRRVFQITILALLIFVAARSLLISLVTYSPIAPNGQALCSYDPFCTFFNPLNNRAAPGERIFVLHGYRYYLRPDLFACSSQTAEYAPLRELASKDGSAFWAELYRQGFRYVTYELHFAEAHAHFPPLPSPQEAPLWLKVSQWNVAIYELQPIAPPFQSIKRCEQDSQGRWQVIEEK